MDSAGKVETEERNPPYICDQCGKAFELESSKKRHGYYCRSKQFSGKGCRKRSCIACTKAKARCDAKKPQCSTCHSKKINCNYHESTHGPPPKASQPPVVTLDSDTPEKNGSVLFDSLDHTSEATGLLNNGNLSFSLAGNDINDLDLSLPQEMCSVQAEFPTLSKLDETHFSTDLESHFDPQFQSNSWNDFSSTTVFHSPLHPTCLPQFTNTTLLSSIPSKDIRKSLLPKSFGKCGSAMSADFLTRIVEAYPAMMLRPETFPPFIHPIWISKDGHRYLPEALVNCMTISKMFVNRGEGNNKFLWRTIRMEQDRIWQEFPKFDATEHLASAQALIIYILMKLIDGASSDNDFDIPPLLSLNFASTALLEFVECPLSNDGNKKDQHDWMGWILQESRRRIETLNRILNMLIDMQIPKTCEPLRGFALFPLPSNKVLWEARDHKTWRSEVNVALKDKEIFGLSLGGELIRTTLVDGNMNTEPADWAKWYSGMDAFGSLIMIASSIL